MTRFVMLRAILSEKGKKGKKNFLCYFKFEWRKGAGSEGEMLNRKIRSRNANRIE
jgi:hypothetical protein